MLTPGDRVIPIHPVDGVQVPGMDFKLLNGWTFSVPSQTIEKTFCYTFTKGAKHPALGKPKAVNPTYEDWREAVFTADGYTFNISKVYDDPVLFITVFTTEKPLKPHQVYSFVEGYNKYWIFTETDKYLVCVVPKNIDLGISDASASVKTSKKLPVKRLVQRRSSAKKGKRAVSYKKSVHKAI